MSIEILPPGSNMPDDLDTRMALAAEMLLAGSTVAEVAEVMGVSGRMVRYWRQDPRFRAHMDRLRSELLDAARDVLRTEVRDAARTVVELSKRGDKDDRTRLAAALAILDRVGVEVEVQATQLPTRIVTRLPASASEAPLVQARETTTETTEAQRSEIHRTREVRRGW